MVLAKIWVVEIKILAITVVTETKIRHGKGRIGAKIIRVGIARAKIERHVFAIERGNEGLLLIDREQKLDLLLGSQSIFFMPKNYHF